MNEILKVESLTKIFTTGKTQVKILDEINLAIEKNEKVCIFGPSGVGKSTLLHIIGLMDEPTNGDIYLFGKSIKKLSRKEKSKIRAQKIGFIFQYHHLLQDLNVFENIELPLMINDKNEKSKIYTLAEILNITHILRKYPSEISVGESQRVALARAIVHEPELIIADEPTGNLDSENAQIVWDLLLRLVKEKNLTLIYATHNDELKKYATKSLLLKNKKIIYDVL